MKNKISEIKALYNKCTERKLDWQDKGNYIRDGFKLSVDIVKTVVPPAKHDIVDKVADTLLTNRGLGWFCDHREELMILTADKQEIAKYAAGWVTKARAAGLQI